MMLGLDLRSNFKYEEQHIFPQFCVPPFHMHESLKRPLLQEHIASDHSQILSSPSSVRNQAKSLISQKCRLKFSLSQLSKFLSY